MAAPPPGVSHSFEAQVGQLFENRKAVALAGIHKPFAEDQLRGRSLESIVLSTQKTYVPLSDTGDSVTITCLHEQDLLPLERCVRLNRSLRLVRGAQWQSSYAPQSGYRFDGMYRVVSATRNPATRRVRCELRRLDGQAPLPAPRSGIALPRQPNPAPRKRLRATDPLGRNTDSILRTVWLCDIPSPEVICKMFQKGKCFLCHDFVFSTTDPDGFSMTELVAHLQMHKDTLELAMSPELMATIARLHQETDTRVRTAVESLEAYASKRQRHQDD